MNKPSLVRRILAAFSVLADVTFCFTGLVVVGRFSLTVEVEESRRIRPACVPLSVSGSATDNLLEAFVSPGEGLV
jgi:hypothetical protein